MRPWVAGGLVGLVVLCSGLARAIRLGNLEVPQGADAPSYLRIARSLLATGRPELAGPYQLREAPQERFGDVYGSPFALTVDGRFFPKHPILFGAVLAPGVAVAGVAGARLTALVLGALLAGVATSVSAARHGRWPAVLAGTAVFLLSPAGPNVLWAINVDTLIVLLWLTSLVLAQAGRPVTAGALAGLTLFLRPTALLLLGGLVLLGAARPRPERLRLLAGFLPPLGILAVLNSVWWGAPWRTAYERIAVLGPGGITLEAVSGQFSLSPVVGLSIILFDPAGGLLATAPVCLVALAGLALPEGRDRLAVAANGAAIASVLLLSSYTFLSRVPETTYRFALPLLVSSVLPLSALIGAALRLRRGRVSDARGAEGR